MENETGQNLGQKRGKLGQESGANQFYGGYHNHFYQGGNEGADYWLPWLDFVLYAFFALAVVFVFGLAVWGLYEIGCLVMGLMKWAYENRKVIGIGLAVCLLVAGLIYIFFEQNIINEQNDKDLV